MRKTFVLCLLVSIIHLVAAATAPAVDITSIQPSTASPGEPVALTGGPFTGTTRVMLGNLALAPDQLTPGRLVVRIPDDMASGDYVIFLTDGEESSQQAFILHLVERPPIIDDISPAVLDVCQPPGQRAEVQVSGSGFARGARVLLDGAAVASNSGGRGILNVSLPALDAGNHRLQVVTPSGSASLPHNIAVSDEPVITSINVGSDDVNSYQLIISGQNFLPRSQLLVDGQPIRSSTLHPLANTDRVEYLDCGTLHYTRYQVTGQLQRVRFRILNPSGRQSETYEVTIR